MPKDFEQLLQSKIKKLQNLPTYKGKLEIEIIKALLFKSWEEAESSGKMSDDKLGWLSKIFDKDTLEWLSSEYDKIVADFSFNESSDLQQLLNYMWRLGRNRVLADQIANPPKNEKTGKTESITSKIEEMDENTVQMIAIGKALRLNKEQREADKKEISLQQKLLTIYERVDAYKKSHQGEYSWRCPSCGEINCLNEPHWAFEKESPFSKETYELVLQGKLTLKDMAYILRTSTFGLKKMAEARGVWRDDLDSQVE